MADEPRACRSCGAAGLASVVDLGSMPPVNHFIDAADMAAERSYPLHLFYCPACHLVQLGDIVPPEQLFANYQHLSSASSSNVKHLQGVAAMIERRFQPRAGMRIVEIGSNDGTLLAALKGSGAELLGIDPAENLLPVSRNRGIETLPRFLTCSLAEELAATRGPADIIIGVNVVPHTPGINELLPAAQRLLAPGGTFIFEAFYLLETVLSGQFDTIYHEHVYAFSLHAARAALKRHGLEVVDVEPLPTQGGSMRVFTQRTEDEPQPSGRVADWLAREAAGGLLDARSFAGVQPRVDGFRRELRVRLAALRDKHGRLIGLGAPARGVVMLNACGLGPEDIDYLIDDTPLKQGKLAPGCHIPVFDWDELTRRPASAYLLLSWNYQDEVLAKLRRHVHQAEVLAPFPDMSMLSLSAL